MSHIALEEGPAYYKVSAETGQQTKTQNSNGTLITFYENSDYELSPRAIFSSAILLFPFISENIFFSTLLSNILSLCPSFQTFMKLGNKMMPLETTQNCIPLLPDTNNDIPFELKKCRRQKRQLI